MNNKILVLGCNGMLGHMTILYLRERGYNVFGFAREVKLDNTFVGDATNFEYLKNIIRASEFDYIINCIGVLNTACDRNPCNAILLNSYLPHFLADITKDTETRIIHVSTDCVFSGDCGNYKVDSKKDAQSLYGISKSLGELNDNKNTTIRTSIIGPDLNENGIGLFNWFIHQSRPINGFARVYWTGLTTLELAKVFEKVIEEKITGLYNVVPEMKISKYELLCLLSQYFNKIKVKPVFEPKIDKSLVNSFEYKDLDYEEMIKELKIWVDSHEIYGGEANE